LREDGEPVALWERYAPSFYVRGRTATLSRALSGLRVVATVTRTERVDVWTGHAVPVVEVRVEDPLRYAGVVARLGRWEDGALELFTCDIPLAQRYCYDRGVFPLAWCEWRSEEHTSELQSRFDLVC